MSILLELGNMGRASEARKKDPVMQISSLPIAERVAWSMAIWLDGADNIST